jgi:hypothetical protein
MSDGRRNGSMTLHRLRALLDAYGANPRCWPAAERESALALLAVSAEARALRADAARLDAMLDLVPAPAPSAELRAHALVGAPPVRRGRWRIIAVALPLAAAVAMLAWLFPGHESPPREQIGHATTDLGAYTRPTDVLLVPPGFDLSGTEPAVGCAESGLGCPLPDLLPQPSPSMPSPARRPPA